MNFTSESTQRYTKNFNLSGQEHRRFYGFYRAKVICNHEDPADTNSPPEQEGRIVVWIPEIMKDIPPDDGIFAYPVQLFWAQGLEGSEDELSPPESAGEKKSKCKVECKRESEGDVLDDYGSFMVPPRGSYIYVTFEDGDINNCRYLPFAPVHLKNKTIQEVKNKCCPERQFYIGKSPHGHRIFISDNDERLSLRSYNNFYIDINEHKEQEYIELWAPATQTYPPKRFGPDTGLKKFDPDWKIGEGNEAEEDPQGQPRENKDNNEDEQNEDDPILGGKGGPKGSWVNKGGQESTIKIKGGNGIHPPEKTQDDSEGGKYLDGPKGPQDKQPAQPLPGKVTPPKIEKGKCEEQYQEGDPLPGYRVEMSPHQDKKFVQIETDEKYIVYLNTHEDDRFIKIQTSEQYRFEMNEHEQKKYIQLESPDGYIVYLNTHEDDRFIKIQTTDGYRFEMNEHEDKRYVQIQTAEDFAFYMNCHEDDMFIRIITPSLYRIELNEHDDHKRIIIDTPSDNHLELNEKEQFVELMTAAGHILRLDDQNQIIELKSGTTDHILVFNMATGNAMLRAPDTITVEAPDIILKGNTKVTGNLTVEGLSELGGGIPVLTTGGPSSTATAG